MTKPEAGHLPSKADEAARLAALDSYGILDTPTEQGFDDIVLLATQICEAPVALVSLVAGDRQWFKARIGFDACETPLSQSVCSHTLWRPGLLVIPDLSADPRTSDNTLVTCPPHIRFYAGVRLETPEGGVLGALCVIDMEPRPQGLIPSQERALEALARQVMAQLELRRATAQQSLRAIEQGRTWQVSPDLLAVINKDAIFERSNPAWQAVLGWSEAEISRTPLFEFLHPDDLERTRAGWNDLAMEQPVLRFENRYRCKNGAYRWLSWVAVPEGGPEGFKVYCSARDVTGEKEAQAALLLYGNIVESHSSPVCAFDTQYRLIAFNQAHSDEFHRIFAHRVSLGEVFPDLFPPDQASVIRGFMARALAGESHTVVEEFGDPKLAKPYWEVSYYPLRDEAGLIIGAFHHASDISPRLRAEAELQTAQEVLRQSQKMEAVGQLTGGLAHDFNNLLAGISGSLELLQARVAQGRIGDLERYLTAAQGAAKRAAALTHRLLAFSRRQTLDPKPTDANRLVVGMEELVRRTVGPEVAVEVVAAGGLWATLVDPNQLENALLNLCINARDAMPGGGQLTIETGNKWLDERSARERDLDPGQYVSLCVSDNGTGMTPQVIARAFDPFFTTKPIGMGTGLGLSMVYGFARQSGGQARIYSEPGQGTMVCLYLPRHHGEAETAEGLGELAEAPRAEQGETVLVVDDEPTVRMLVADVLGDLGYTAIEAADGTAGLKVLQSNARIDLLVTDVGLPGMNGRQVADAGRVARPGLKVLFITGYAENALLNHGHLDPGMHVLTKPFAMDALANRIKELIAGP